MKGSKSYPPATTQTTITLRQSSTASSNTPESREKCAAELVATSHRVAQMSAFVGLDGFVDEIFHVVDKRESAEKYLRLPTIAQLATRLQAAAGRSANIEFVSQLTKLAGKGP